MLYTVPTARLTLRPIRNDDLKYFIELNSDPLVMRYVQDGKPLNGLEVAQDLAFRQSRCEPTLGLGYWAGFIEDDFVGWWSLAPEWTGGRPKLGVAELGFRLLSKYWRQGLAKEGAIELLRHGFEDLGLKEVFATTMAVNTASRATMEACGLEYSRTFFEEFDCPIPGTEEGEVEYRVSKDAWLSWSAQ